MSDRQEDRQAPISLSPGAFAGTVAPGGDCDASGGGHRAKVITTRKHLGGRPRQYVDPAMVKAHLDAGLSLRQTARKLRVSYGTLHLACR